MIKISKKKFNEIFGIKPEFDKNIKYSLDPEFRKLIEILMDKTGLDFFEILDLIKNW